MKIAYLFSGQGVQFNVVREHYSVLKNNNAPKTEKSIQILQTCLNEINPNEKFDVLESLSNQSSSSWTKTSFVQPLTYTLGTLAHDLAKEKNPTYTPSYMMGHSLGAFTALAAAGALSLEEGCEIVCARGKFMQEDSEKSDMGMISIVGLTEEAIDEICKKTNTVIALKNAPSAFVVGGPRSAFETVEKEAAIRNARKTIRLGTSGAFHTKSMQGAYEKFKKFFDKHSLKIPQVAIVTNINGRESLNPEEIKADCIESIINPVNWVRMMEFLKNNGVNYYIESGPGGGLGALARLNGIEREKIHQASEFFEPSIN